MNGKDLLFFDNSVPFSNCFGYLFWIFSGSIDSIDSLMIKFHIMILVTPFGQQYQSFCELPGVKELVSLI